MELPSFFPGPRVMRRNEAALARSCAGPAGDDLALDNDRARSSSRFTDPRLPSDFAIARVQRDKRPVRRREINHVFVDGEAFRLGISFALVFPDERAVRRIERLNDGSGMECINHPSINERDTFLTT